MKTKQHFKQWLLPAFGLAALVLLSAFVTKTPTPPGYVAHEWGTFTSVQGGDGRLQEWRPLQSSGLPAFVYDWQHPGPGRAGAAGLVYGKGWMSTLQRMETPVIYFYAGHEETVDVSVRFPLGLLTEWYPQADRVGPAVSKPSSLVTELDSLAHKAGARPSFTFASWAGGGAMKESGARWSHVQLLPVAATEAALPSLPRDRSGSHYFAARETDANCLRVRSPCSTNSAPEQERFIFYRGVGSFATPLRVTMETSGATMLENTGTEALTRLFVLEVAGQNGRFISLENLFPGERVPVRLDSSGKPAPLKELSVALGAQMADSLVHEGLYRREAEAMVKTWEDSWFEEAGVRVLYVLPRPWTDRTLPLTLVPAPRELVRVMVGRAEILTPALEQRLTDELRRTRTGDPEARERLLTELKKLGRFGDPALRLATAAEDSESRQLAWSLFQAAAQTSANPF